MEYRAFINSSLSSLLQMTELLGLTVDIDEHEDIMAPTDDNEVVVRKYTMGGFYHIEKQMDVIIETIDAMCPSQ